ncbi:PaaI family thioesterase [Marinicauda algicola]|uniref:Medium/long-chain acyl-CoA thioesterase YigI n=1 Tax=Marinicauda algicola TaxID=2029849 RepID=A0A4S2GX01_9PROT|nr:PaaI family thioesterase [Marinicauda algicola]TGY87586.1 PaaI family thioesterase [Marinicauda algicola]
MTDIASGRREPEVTAEQFRRIMEIQPFTRWTGVELVRVERGLVETRLKLRKQDMTQHHGFLHGGLVAFLADNAAAYAAATEVGDVLTSQFSLNFLSPGVGDAFFTRAEVVKAGRRQVTVRVDVFAESEGQRKLIAIATATILPAGSAAIGRLPEAR